MDTFDSYRPGLTAPATKHFALVADPGTDLDPRPRAVRCQTDGNLTIRDEDGVDVTYIMVAGEVLTLRPVRVTAIGAGSFVGWL